MEKYVMKQDNRDEWRWKYVASNGETIAVSSEGYKNKTDCRHSINLVKQSKDAAVVEE